VVHLEAIVGIKASWLSLLRSFIGLYKLITNTRPDIVISFQDIANYPALFACLFRKSSLVISERQDLRFYRLPRLRSVLRWCFYRFADAIVVQTEQVKDQLESVLDHKIHVISNPLCKASIIAQPAKSPSRKYRIISVGRLEKQKNYPLLLEAAAQVLRKHSDWTLHIFGEGSQRSKLNEQIVSAKMENRIFLEKFTASIAEEMARAHLFVLPSNYEGFPNSLAEATAAGLPCIAYSDVSGVSELIKNGENGILLAPDQRDKSILADAIEGLVVNNKLRADMGRKGMSNVEKYSNERILDQWLEVLSQSSISAAKQ
jgi:glycosyltransferase involved in cell wall biosynthesis